MSVSVSVSISPLSIQISIAPLTGLAFCLAARLSQKLPVLVILVKRENKSHFVCVFPCCLMLLLFHWLRLFSLEWILKHFTTVQKNTLMTSKFFLKRLDGINCHSRGRHVKIGNIPHIFKPHPPSLHWKPLSLLTEWSEICCFLACQSFYIYLQNQV